MARRRSDVLEVVVLAADAHALLAARRALVVALFLAEEHVLELVHPGVGEQQRRIVVRDERRAGHDTMAVPLEILQKRRANLSPGHCVGTILLWNHEGTKAHSTKARKTTDRHDDAKSAKTRLKYALVLVAAGRRCSSCGRATVDRAEPAIARPTPEQRQEQRIPRVGLPAAVYCDRPAFQALPQARGLKPCATDVTSVEAGHYRRSARDVSASTCCGWPQTRLRRRNPAVTR